MTPAQPAGLDIWKARIPLERLGRHEFTVIAWRDDFASLVDHIQKKLKAGTDRRTRTRRGVASVRAGARRGRNGRRRGTEPLERIVKEFTKADAETKLALAARADHGEGDDRRAPPAVPVARSGHYRIDADRTAARFASWYEIFPRSMSDDESATARSSM